MPCPRCSGLMVNDWFQDLLDDTGEIDFYGTRCVMCGEILDPVILMNRMTLTVGSSLVH